MFGKFMKIKNYQENIFFLIFTFLLAPFFYGLILINRSKKNELKRPLKFLVIQFAKIGDLVCSTPVFREIKKHYPSSFLSVLVIPRVEGILINNPHLDEIILLDREKYQGIRGIFKLIKEIRDRHFDWSFSLLPGLLNNLIPFWAAVPHRAATTSKYTTKGAKVFSIFNNYRLEYKRHTLALRHYLNLLRFINITKFSEKKELFVGLKEEKKALHFLEEHNLKKEDFLVGISVTAGNKFKEWSLEKFARLADRLIQEFDAKIIFMGAAQEKAFISQAQILMKGKSIDSSQFFSLSEAPALFQYLKMFISVDTGSLYMANAMGAPIVDISGPIDIYEQPPLGDKCEIVQKKLACLPCSFIVPPARFCRKGTRQCIEDITVDDVFEAVKRLYFSEKKKI